VSNWTNPDTCTICGHHGYCGETSDGNVIHCRYAASDHPTASGWLHFNKGVTSNRAQYVGARVVTIDTRQTRTDIAAIAAGYTHAAWPSMVEDFAEKLGVTPNSLHRLRIGWAHDTTSRKGAGTAIFDAGDMARQCGNRVFSFPMVDALMHTIGIRLRREDGDKYSVGGGREGLFVPDDLADGNLLICEGPTDCAALLDLGFAAVGRPSCTGGVRLLVELIRARDASEVTIVSDADAPGRRGAESLASVLRLYCRTVRIIEPPPGIKDARAWRRAGGTTADVQGVIDAAPIRSLRITAPAMEVAYA
jgi:hypothetical protein